MDAKVDSFEITQAIMMDGISAFSLKKIKNLHLGFEEIIRERPQDDPREGSPSITLHLRNSTVRQILDELCKFDPRYVWSIDGATINIFPKSTASESAYLLNLHID